MSPSIELSAEAIAALLPTLRRYARALTRDPARADDLVQDCIERALTRRHLWRPTGEPRAWLFTLMHNLHVNTVRAEGRRGPSVSLEHASGAASPPEQADRVAAGQTLMLLERLPPEQRSALALVVLEGMSYGEVARIQGVAIGTVMSRLARARAALRAADREKPALRRIK